MRPLCGMGVRKGERCGIGHMDGRIEGWKLLGHLKLSSDCTELADAWSEVQQKQSKLDAMPVMQRELQRASSTMACEWTPPSKGKDASSGQAAAGG
eukprot:6179113-Pleurochrysis_carterae.AAC.2